MTGAYRQEEAQMYCPQCGASNNDNAASCSACGYDLDNYQQEWREGMEQPAGETSYQAGASGGQPGAGGQPPAGGQPWGQAPQTQPPQGQGNQWPPQDQRGYPNQPYQGGSYPPPPYQQHSQRNYQSPPYQTGGYGPYGSAPRIPNYLGWAIAVLILCFWPTGIAAVVFAAQVDNRVAIGDYFGAQESSRKAKMWCWITFGIGVGLWVIAIAGLIFAIAIGTSVSTSIGNTVY